MVYTYCSSFYLMSFDLFWDPWDSRRPFICEFSGSWPEVSLTSPIKHEMIFPPFCFHSAMVPCMKGGPVIYISLIRLRLYVCRAHNNHDQCAGFVPHHLLKTPFVYIVDCRFAHFSAHSMMYSGRKLRQTGDGYDGGILPHF